MAALKNDVIASELFWWMMKQKKTAPASDFLLIAQPFGLMRFINPELLPEFEAVKKYFGSSEMHGISKPQGFYFEFKDINPDRD